MSVDWDFPGSPRVELFWIIPWRCKMLHVGWGTANVFTPWGMLIIAVAGSWSSGSVASSQSLCGGASCVLLPKPFVVLCAPPPLPPTYTQSGTWVVVACLPVLISVSVWGLIHTDTAHGWSQEFVNSFLWLSLELFMTSLYSLLPQAPVFIPLAQIMGLVACSATYSPWLCLCPGLSLCRTEREKGSRCDHLLGPQLPLQRWALFPEEWKEACMVLGCWREKKSRNTQKK